VLRAKSGRKKAVAARSASAGAVRRGDRYGSADEPSRRAGAAAAPDATARPPHAARRFAPLKPATGATATATFLPKRWRASVLYGELRFALASSAASRPLPGHRISPQRRSVRRSCVVRGGRRVDGGHFRAKFDK